MFRTRWLSRKVRYKITLIVQSGDETLTLHGVLWEELQDGVLLRSVQVDTPEGRKDMGGEVWVPRDRIVFGQSLDGLS